MNNALKKITTICSLSMCFLISSTLTFAQTQTPDSLDQNIQVPQSTPEKIPAWAQNLKIGEIYYNKKIQTKNKGEELRIKDLPTSYKLSTSDIYSILKSFHAQTKEEENELVQQAYALAIIKNILKHEVLLSPLHVGVSQLRVEYVLRSILTYAATATKHIKTKQVPAYDSMGNEKKNSKGETVFTTVADENTSKMNLEEMYGWLKNDLVGSNYISKLNIKWDYEDGGLDFYLNILNSTEPFKWKNITFYDLDLPNTVTEFRAKLTNMLTDAFEKNKIAWVYSTLKNKYVSNNTLSYVASDLRILSITHAQKLLNELKARKMVKEDTSINDEKTRNSIYNLMINNSENYIQRELIYNLLEQNTFIPDYKICALDKSLPCVATDPASLTKALFPEVRIDNGQDKTSLGSYTDFKANTLQIGADYISFLLSM